MASGPNREIPGIPQWQTLVAPRFTCLSFENAAQSAQSLGQKT
jgi:hypothetical protein